MNKLKVRRWTGAFGIVACVLLIAAFPLYYPFVRSFVVRLRNASKMSTRSLSLRDKVVLYVKYPSPKGLILTHIFQSDRIKDEHTRLVGSQELGRANLWERPTA